MTRGSDVGFKVTGLTKLGRDLQALGLEVTDLKDAFASIAAEGADVAAGLAPRDSGDLAGSIRGNRAKSKAVVIAGNKRKVPYAGGINYGWGSRHISYKHGRYAVKGLRGSYGGAHFMQKADDIMRPKAIAALEAAINRKIREKGLS